MRSSKTLLLSALTWFVCARRAVMSDPAVNESTAMAQTLHLLDFPPCNFQQLSVMGLILSLPQVFNVNPNKFMPREGQLSDLPSSRAALEGSWPGLRPQKEGEALPEIQAGRAGERHRGDLPSSTLSPQKRSRRRQSRHQPERHL